MNNECKVVLLTGGSSGIGAETARLLAAAGMTVYAASRRGTAGCDSGNVIPIKLDVNDEEATKAAVDEIISKSGRLDAVIVNAGNGIAGAIEDTSDEEARFQFETCFFGALKTVRACLPVFRRQNSGRIVTVTSVAAVVPLPYQGLYSSVKSALLTFTEALAIELKGSGIQCCSILPGDTATGFTGARRFTEASGREDSPYREKFSAYLRKIEHDELGGMPSSRIAKAVLRQLRRRRMAIRVTPRIDYKAVGLLVRLLPSKLKLWIIGLLYN